VITGRTFFGDPLPLSRLHPRRSTPLHILGI